MSQFDETEKTIRFRAKITKQNRITAPISKIPDFNEGDLVEIVMKKAEVES